MPSSRAARLTAIAVTVLTVLVALSLVACRKSQSVKIDGPTPPPAVEGSNPVSGTAPIDGSSAVAETMVPEPLSSGSDVPGSPNTGGAQPKPEPKPAVVVSADKGVPLKVMWWNDTVDRLPEGFEVVYAGQSFKPDSGKQRDSGSIGPCPYDTTVTLLVYPDGRGGPKFVVPITATKVMQANSERDAIHVQVSDGSVRVLGNAVDNFEQTFNR